MEEKKTIKISLGTFICTIIIILLLAIIGIMYVYYNSNEKDNINEKVNIIENTTNSSNVEDNNKTTISYTQEEVEEYIDSIYFVLGNCISPFDDINNANEDWVWACVYKAVAEKYAITDEISKSELEDIAKEIFGEDFSREFPEEGIEWLIEPIEDEDTYSLSWIGRIRIRLYV